MHNAEISPSIGSQLPTDRQTMSVGVVANPTGGEGLPVCSHTEAGSERARAMPVGSLVSAGLQADQPTFGLRSDVAGRCEGTYEERLAANGLSDRADPGTLEAGILAC